MDRAASEQGWTVVGVRHRGGEPQDIEQGMSNFPGGEVRIRTLRLLDVSLTLADSS